MIKTYITHITRDYLDVAINLAKSLQLFSKIPLIIYCIGLEDSDRERFNSFNNVTLKNIDLDIEPKGDDYVFNDSGNFYINRKSHRIYHILCAKTIAMQMALEEGYDEVCYLDSDCLATPIVDELFNWTSIISDFPIATEGIHEYMVMVENSKQHGNPFEFTWPVADNKLSLEWPLMNFMQMLPEQRGRYRTTGIMLMNQNCLDFIRSWRELCFRLPKIVDVNYYAPYHEETVYNVLSWKKENKGFPLCYINLDNGVDTVKHFYSDEAKEGVLRWSDDDSSQNFYKIPDNKKYVKVFHGEKRTDEVNKILNYLKNINNDMLKFIYTEPSGVDSPFGNIRFEVGFGNDDSIKFPLTFQVISVIDNKVIWETKDMRQGCWSSLGEPCNRFAVVKNADDEIIKKWTWDQEKHGDYIHREFYKWCKLNKGAAGIAIGTHDGTTGEWVAPLREGLITGYLVEASDKQYDALVNNYKSNTIQAVVTTDGADVVFFEGPEGYTNSVNKEHVSKYCENENIVAVNKKSISLNDLIIKCGLEKDLKWLHLDVEGIDTDLIMSLDDARVTLPEIIIYETLNTSDNDKKKTVEWLNKKGYDCVESGWNTIATKRQEKLSMLVHTCDSYEKYWAGMLYTLDFYWDYDKIPVYFASEKKSLSNITFDCKGFDYKADNRIRQILTDEGEFSTRFIDAVKKIPSKYVLYIQEDMWLKRSLDEKLLQEIIDFMENNNADSVRLHSKLFYYDTYGVEPTNHVIFGQKLLKSTGS